MPTKNQGGPKYIRPGRNVRLSPDDQSLIPLPDAKAEQQREAAIKDRLFAIKRRCISIAAVVDTAITLIERGITLPDVAEAIGLPPTIERVSRPLRRWRIRSNSNMAVVADMLEEAGREGVSETEMMHRLRDLGRLTDADKPLRAVHWAVTELQRRTRFIERGHVRMALGGTRTGRLRSGASIQHEKTKLPSLDLLVRIEYNVQPCQKSRHAEPQKNKSPQAALVFNSSAARGLPMSHL